MAATDSDTQPSGTTPGGIVEFLLARIAEDEEAARAAGGDAWEQDDRPSRRNVVLPRRGFDWVGVSGERLDVPVLTAQVSNTARSLFEARAGHIALHDPARVLAECQAKRAIIAAHQHQVTDDDPDAWIVLSESLLRHLAAVYADHPDYDEPWRP